MERLMRKVVVHEGCWLWAGAQAGNGSSEGRGYGIMWTGKRNDYVHRIAYEHSFGPIPEGLEIDHLCRVRRCVNPAHLEAVTHAENKRRARRTHCQRGHELTPRNCGTRRMCKRCDADRSAARRRGLTLA